MDISSSHRNDVGQLPQCDQDQNNIGTFLQLFPTLWSLHSILPSKSAS